MKYLLILLYLSGYQPVLEHRWFDTLEQCSTSGQVRANFLLREGLVKPLAAGCYEISVQEATDGTRPK